MNHVFESPIVRTLAGANIALLLLMIVPMLSPLPEASKTNVDSIGVTDIADYFGRPEVAMSAAIDRPIFHANRRPAVARPEQAAPVAQPVQQEERLTLELVGIMGMTAEQRTAFLQDASSATTHAVKAGQILQGWTVVSIEADTVTLSKGPQERILSLN